MGFIIIILSIPFILFGLVFGTDFYRCNSYSSVYEIPDVRWTVTTGCIVKTSDGNFVPMTDYLDKKGWKK